MPLKCCGLAQPVLPKLGSLTLLCLSCSMSRTEPYGGVLTPAASRMQLPSISDCSGLEVWKHLRFLQIVKAAHQQRQSF